MFNWIDEDQKTRPNVSQYQAIVFSDTNRQTAT